jgi:hypothetical protein
MAALAGWDSRQYGAASGATCTQRTSGYWSYLNHLLRIGFNRSRRASRMGSRLGCRADGHFQLNFRLD